MQHGLDLCRQLLRWLGELAGEIAVLLTSEQRVEFQSKEILILLVNPWYLWYLARRHLSDFVKPLDKRDLILFLYLQQYV